MWELRKRLRQLRAHEPLSVVTHDGSKDKTMKARSWERALRGRSAFIANTCVPEERTSDDDVDGWSSRGHAAHVGRKWRASGTARGRGGGARSAALIGLLAYGTPAAPLISTSR